MAREELPVKIRRAFRDQNYLSIDEMCTAFDLSRGTIKKLVDQGTLPAHQISKRLFFTIEDVEAYWKRTAVRRNLNGRP